MRPRPPVPLQEAEHGVEQVLDAQRLGQHGVDPARGQLLGQVAGEVARRFARDHHDPPRAVQLARLARQTHAVAVGQRTCRQQQIDAAVGERRARALEVGGVDDLDSFARQHARDEVARRFVALDDQDARRLDLRDRGLLQIAARRPAGPPSAPLPRVRAIGRCTRSVAPRSGTLSIEMKPPARRTIDVHIARPRPVPSPMALVVKKGSNARS